MTDALTQQLGPVPTVLVDKRATELDGVFDWTGSMDDPANSNDPFGPTKGQVLNQFMFALVSGLVKAKADTAGQDEKGGGGLKAYGFNNGRVYELGDININNFSQKWHPKFDGITIVNPALQLADQRFHEEFDQEPYMIDGQPVDGVYPHLMRIFATDGTMRDHSAVNSHLAQASGYIHYYVIVIGDGEEATQATTSWRTLAQQHPQNIVVESLNGLTDGAGLADRVLSAFK